MGKSKQNKSQKKDGNHRAETREEKLERFRQQEEARQACFELLPMLGGVVVSFLLIFGSYVNSIPPKAPKPKITPAPGAGQTMGDINRILAEGMTANVADKVKVEIPLAAPEAPPAPKEETVPADGEHGEL